MARTVDVGSTFENWRQNYNNLATDVGDPVALTTVDKTSVVNAINYIMDQYFFFQDFDFDGSDGDSSNTVFPGSAMSGLDNAGNTFQYKPQKVLVYKNGLLLRSGTDYTAINGTTITLAASANNGDVIRVSSYTGSYTNTPSGAESQFYWQTAGSNVYNNNSAGIVLQTGRAIASIVTAPTVADSIQLDGDTYVNADLYLNAQKDLRFRDSDSSHYVAVQAPGTVSTNRTLTLPSAEDGYMIAVAAVGSNGQVLSSDGDGSYSWTNVSNTNTTYSTSWVDSSSDAILRLTPSTGSADDLTIVAGTGITVTPSGDNLTIAATASLPTAITVADESSDTTCFPAFFTAATGDLGPKTGTNLTFNSSSGVLTATGFAGPITGNVTGNVAGTLTGTVATSTQNSITTMTGLVTVGTIGTGVWQGTAIAQGYIAADAINGSKIADDSIDSEHYADASIDLAHMSANSVDSAQYVDGSIDLVHLDPGMIQLSSESFADNNTSLMTSAAIADKIEAYGYTTETGDITGVTAGSGMSGGGTSGTVTLTNAGVTSIVAGSNVSISGGTGAVTITSTDTNTTYSVGDGGLTTNDFTNADHSKLNAIEANATADQSNTEIRNAVEAASDSNTFTDADHSKLNAIEAGATADQTSVSGNAGTATALATGRTIGMTGDVAWTSASFTGAGNVTGTSTIQTDAVDIAMLSATGTASSSTFLRGDNSWVTPTDTDTTYTAGDGIGLSSTTFSVAGGTHLTQDDNGLSLATSTNVQINALGVNRSNTTQGTIIASGDITAFASSDIALKENIINIPNPLEKLSKIGGYMFDWKKDHKVEGVLGEGHDTGILAQEIEEILPEIVELRKTGIKAVNYTKLIPLLVESIKELKRELDDLKSSNS